MVLSRMAEDKYKLIKSIFPNGTWVTGVGEHQGCSEVFTDYGHTHPFAYLDETRPNLFRVATHDEILAMLGGRV
jgi:hypothetical protein